MPLIIVWLTKSIDEEHFSKLFEINFCLENDRSRLLNELANIKDSAKDNILVF